MNHDIFGQEAAKTRRGRSQERAAAEADGAGEDYGGVGKDLDKDFGHLAARI